ncbi:hypothetical protein GBAR_LOCUS12977, partial [Geodia barretti]
MEFLGCVARLFVEEAQQILKKALLSDGGTSVCSHLQRVFNSSEKLNLVEYGSQPPDHSLLDDTNLLWSGSATLQKDTVYLTLQAEDEGPVLFVSPTAHNSPTLGNVFNETSNDIILQNRLLNMTYNCASKKLSIHIDVSSPTAVIKNVLSFNRFTFSLSMVVDSRDAFETAVFSGSTTFLDIPAFVAVRFKYATRAVDIRGVPTERSITLEKALEAISVDGLKMPTNNIRELSNVALFGKIEKGMTTFAMEGRSNGCTVVLLHELSNNSSNAALIACISSIGLQELIMAVSDTNISRTPIYSDLAVSNLRFSSATGEISTPLLSQIFPTNSPLAVFGSRIHSGIRAYLTAQIAGVSMTGILSHKKLVFEVPSGTQIQLSKLLSSYPPLSGLGSFPLVGRSIIDSRVSRVSYDPDSKLFVLSSHLPKLLLIPNVMLLSNVALDINATLQQTLSVTQLNLTSSWLFGSLNVTTQLSYNGTEGVYHVRGFTTQTLQINDLFRNILGSDLPSALKSLTLTTAVGSIYSNGNYIIIFSGSLREGKVCLVFLKDSTGTKLGLVASVKGTRLSDLVHSANGVDISGTPFFGDLNISMAVSIASAPIEKSRLINILPKEINKVFPTDGDMFPVGVVSHFRINVSGTIGTDCTLSNGIVKCTSLKSANFTVKHLAREIPGLRKAIDELPSEISSVINAKVNTFSFNSTTNEFIIGMEMNKLVFVKEFLSLSGVRIRYEGRLGSVISTTSIEIEGTWHISE